MGRLLLLFIVVPAIELALLIELGARLGTLPTLGIIAVTGVIGAYLARLQGLSVIQQAREQMRRGELPAGSLADGVMILVAGALLMTPGILTDAVGFSLLVPALRRRVKAYARERFRKAVQENRIQVHVAEYGFHSPSSESQAPFRPIDIDMVREDSGDDLLGEALDDRNGPKYKIH
jgi:UPF0716 protein FxsA